MLQKQQPGQPQTKFVVWTVQWHRWERTSSCEQSGERVKSGKSQIECAHQCLDAIVRTVFGTRMLDFGKFDFGQFDFGQLAEIELAEVEIGRSRNWPKSKLAEVEINWPKSNRWCLLCFFFLSFFFFFCFVFLLFFTFFLFLLISLFILFLFCSVFVPKNLN